MILYDTSIFVAAAQRMHPRHVSCLDLIARSERVESCCAMHSIVEMFSVLTRMPPPHRLSPEIAWQIVEQFRAQMKVIALDEAEQVATIREMVERGQAGGMVYDALILRCARKAKAKTIYTLNARHFRMIAPDLADRIVEP